MKCPYCGKDIPGPVCPGCGAASPEGAKFCMMCGSSLDEIREDVHEDNSEFDPDSRILCPDGTCTGIIVDGKCTECGKEVKEG